MNAHNVIDIAPYRNKEDRVRKRVNKGKAGSVYARNGKLWVSFQYLGKRLREPTGLSDSKENRITVRKQLDLITAEIENNCFKFAKRFPHSKKREQIAEFEGRRVKKNPEEVLFGKYVKAWLMVMLPGMSSGKIRDYKSVLKNYLVQYFKDIPFSEFTPFLMKKFLAHLSGKETRLGKKLSPATIRNCIFRSKKATVPAGKRPPFRRESGHHSGGKKATIPEQSGQYK